MCRRCQAQRRQDAAAEELIRACVGRFLPADLRNPDVVKHLPAPPGDFAGLLERLRNVPLRIRTQH